MIHYVRKDITTVDRGIVAHGCNCQGVMGAGVALAIRNRWPTVYDNYVRLCEVYHKSQDMMGLVQLVGLDAEVEMIEELQSNETNMLFVANMFTQHKYGTDRVHADPVAIEGALAQVVHMGSLINLPVYIPRIGCGLGGLSWKDTVQPIVVRVSEEYPAVDIYVCEP